MSVSLLDTDSQPPNSLSSTTSNNQTIHELWRTWKEISIILEEKWNLLRKHYKDICRNKLQIDKGHKEYEASFKICVTYFNSCNKEFVDLYKEFNIVQEKLRNAGVAVDFVNEKIKKKTSTCTAADTSNLNSKTKNNDDLTNISKELVQDCQKLSFQNVSPTYWSDLAKQEKQAFEEFENKKAKNKEKFQQNFPSSLVQNDNSQISSNTSSNDHNNNNANNMMMTGTYTAMHLGTGSTGSRKRFGSEPGGAENAHNLINKYRAGQTNISTTPNNSIPEQAIIQRNSNRNSSKTTSNTDDQIKEVDRGQWITFCFDNGKSSCNPRTKKAETIRDALLTSGRLKSYAKNPGTIEQGFILLNAGA